VTSPEVVVVPRGRRRWIWLCWVLCLLLVGGLVTYLVRVGLDDADKISSSVAAVAALFAFFAPYLLPSADPAEPTDVHAGGAAAVAIGEGNTGAITAQASGVLPAVRPSPPGDGVSATGPASVAIGGKNKADVRTTYRGPGHQK
jgi:hypothetical protein